MALDLNTLHLPLGLCRDHRLLGGTVLHLKLALIAEALREPGEQVITLPMGRLAEWAGVRAEVVRTALSRGLGLRVEVRDRWDRIEPFDERATSAGRGVGATATLAFTPEWTEACDEERVIAVPLQEVTEMTTRCGLLLRLRAAGVLHGRTARTHPRLRISTADLPHYTGYEGDASPHTVVRQYLMPGLADVGRTSRTVEIGARTAHRDGEHTRTWLRHIEWTVAPIRTREIA